MPNSPHSALDVLYDDGPCLVINKPAGLLTQAPVGIDSLELHVREFYKQRENTTGKIYLGIVHRIDRPVTGCIAFGRHVRAASRMAAQFQQRTVDKTYWAFVEGRVSPDQGTWTDHLHKRHGMSQSIVVPEDDPRGKLAVLHYRVLHATEEGTWLEIQLETGRTHQIRVQAASRGHAIWGDSQYGSQRLFGDQAVDLRERGIALHARFLGLRHPMRDERVEVTAPLPASWEALQLPAAAG
ncbi:Ribosomal large subunit pseudouridine synthase D [Pseudobythopirellula maris]|uniref:Ribosomal large subunit pseudouridine synthase D n=1 Tax=Pseudobythopirellula maris TaxID=2527991 RepID=A0A5C5ZTW5_9BACT|nr:RNA pseudouridine synthase [Pseudobythopirellula maris]TWT90700.1 Ribosomal large subunit pseudouridine synthase D [Pseudobythopirellula maris]